MYMFEWCRIWTHFHFTLRVHFINSKIFKNIRDNSNAVGNTKRINTIREVLYDIFNALAKSAVVIYVYYFVRNIFLSRIGIVKRT